MDEGLKRQIVQKAEHLRSMILKQFGGVPNATAPGGQDDGREAGMRVTRSAASNAPGEVQDGKLVDVKALAAAAARQDIPPTDLLALARQCDPHNEDNIPTTIAGAVTAGSSALGDLEKEQKQSLHSKQHPATEKAVDTGVESQVTEQDPYKTLHAGAEVEAIVARAKAVIQGAKAITEAATEVPHPGAGKVEGHPIDPAKGEDAGKNAVDSAKTLANAKSRKDVLAAIKQRLAETRKAKVEGHPIDPARGEDAGKTPEESAKTLGDGGTTEHRAEAKDRPVAVMPDHKHRYAPDTDPRDDIAKSYWQKAKKDEARWDSESDTDRPLTRETQEKLPKLAPKAEVRRNLLTRLAGLDTVIASSDEAERLHLQRKQYSKDTPKDMDFEGAASRTQGEIEKEHGERERGTHPYSPMFSKLWGLFGPVKTAKEDTGYHGKMPGTEDKANLKKQIAELQKAVKGVDVDAEGSESQMQALNTQITKMEADMAKASGIQTGTKGHEALAATFERLNVIREALRDINVLCAASHMELRFAEKFGPEMGMEMGTDMGAAIPEMPGAGAPAPAPPMPPAGPKPPAGPAGKSMGGVMDQTTKLVQDLGETVEDMEHAVDSLMKEMGIQPKPKALDKEKSEPGHKAPPKKEDALPSAPKKDEGPKEEGPKEEKEASWKAVFNKVASKDDAKKADMLASYWEVMRNDQPVLRASVSELYPVKTAAEQEKAFAWCATKEYGTKLLAACKTDGVEKTAKLLGVMPMVKSAADKALEQKIKGEQAFYAKAYGSDEYARELLKDHARKAAAEKADLMKKLAAEKDRNDRLEGDIKMRAKAERVLRLANVAVGKGVLAAEKKSSFIDELMTGSEDAYKAAESLVNGFTPVAKVAEDQPVLEAGKTTAKEMLRQAAAGPGLKTPVVIQSQAASPFTGLQGQLEGMWRKPPTAQ